MAENGGGPLRSATITGLATARAMLRPLGFTRERLAKPNIGVAHMWSEDQLVPLSVNEIRRLHATFNRPAHPPEHHERWSRWRRRHQLRARTCHYRQRQIRDHKGPAPVGRRSTVTRACG